MTNKNFNYAIEEVYSLLGKLPNDVDDIDERSPIVLYLCALFAELAYYLIPKWEIDNDKRAKLIPCDRYKEILRTRTPTDSMEFINIFLDLPGFVVVDRGVVAVGIVMDHLLFIGFRGTQFLYDWKINIRSRLIPIAYPRDQKFIFAPDFFLSQLSGRLHSGFAEEALRISIRIQNAILDLKPQVDINRIFLSGHSLGGAVAAISSNLLLRFASASVCIFGAPRYSDLSSYFSHSYFFGHPFRTLQVRRSGDVVPTIPPKIFGYADHPYVFDTNGEQFSDPFPYLTPIFGEFLRWSQFLLGGFNPHKIEEYRREIGESAGAVAAGLPLAPIKK